MAEYYDMQEVTSKLRKSEDEVQNLIKEGRLRQYMDSGKAVFKVEDVDALAEEIVGLDISSFGETPPEEEGSDLDIMLDETSDEIELAPDDNENGQGDKSENKDEMKEPSQSSADDIELDLEPDQDTEEANKPKESSQSSAEDIELDIEPDIPDQKESEGGFGLSQMGDLTMADTNVGTVGINILSGTGDAYQLTEDSKAETQAADIDDLDSLDADSNLESFGSGSGLLDLSLQADDTSLGAVLDDILPTGAEGGEAGGADMPVDEGVGLLDESEDLLSEGETAVQGGPEEVTAPMGAAAAAPVMPGPASQMVAVAPVDPKSNMFGVMMFLPLVAMVLAAIALTAAIQGVMPSLVKTLVETEIAGFSLIWVIVAALAGVLLIILLFASVSGGSGGKTRTAKTKAKKEKPAKKKKKRK